MRADDRGRDAWPGTGGGQKLAFFSSVRSLASSLGHSRACTRLGPEVRTLAGRGCALIVRGNMVRLCVLGMALGWSDVRLVIRGCFFSRKVIVRSGWVSLGVKALRAQLVAPIPS